MIILQIPPLREREDDIPLLIKHFVNRFNKKLGKQIMNISPDLINTLMEYCWRGNVRELEHVIESAMNMIESNEEFLTMANIPPYQRENILAATKEPQLLEQKKDTGIKINGLKGNLDEILHDLEKRILIDTLKSCHGNTVKAARLLGVHRQGIQYRIRRYGLTLADFKD